MNMKTTEALEPVTYTNLHLPTIEAAFRAICDEFRRRYPTSTTIVTANRHGNKGDATDRPNRTTWNLSHHFGGACDIGSGATPYAAMADLEQRLGTAPERAARLRAEAATLVAHAEKIEAELSAQTKQLAPA